MRILNPHLNYTQNTVVICQNSASYTDNSYLALFRKVYSVKYLGIFHF